jgi:hypothetical protein
LQCYWAASKLDQGGAEQRTVKTAL